MGGFGFGTRRAERKRAVQASPGASMAFPPDMPLIRTGDSIAARGDNTDWLQWANFLAFGRFQIPSYGYHAISASEINEPAGVSPRTNHRDVLRADRMSYFLAGARPGVACLAAIGANSIASNTPAQMRDGYNELADAIKATGAASIMATILPAGTIPNPAPVNAWLTDEGRSNIDLVVDAAAEWAEHHDGPHAYDGNVDSGNNDALHPNVRGAVRAGHALRHALEAKGCEIGATYGLTGSPADNICTCWNLTGTTGTKSGTNTAAIAGTVPTGVTVTLNSTGVTAHMSVGTEPVPVLASDGGNGWSAQVVEQPCLVLELAGSAIGTATNNVRFAASISPGEPAGSTYEGLLYGKLTGADGASAPAAGVNIGLGSSSATLFTWSNANTKAGAGFIDLPVAGVMRGWTRGAVAGTGVNNLDFQFRLSPGPVSCRLVLAMPYFRKVQRMPFGEGRPVHNARDDLGGPVVGATVGSSANWTAVAGSASAAVRPGEAWSGDGLTFSYQWQKSADKVSTSDISGASGLTYTPQPGDGFVRCRITPHNSFGAGEPSYTAWSGNSV